MRRTRSARRWIAGGLAATLVSAALPVVPAQAGMVTTDQIVRSIATQQDRDRVYQFMDREDVRRQMESWGVDPMEAAARVRGLTDAEIAGIVGKIEQLPAGQDAAGAIIGAALAIFLIFIITDILGFTDVFPFVSSIEE